MLGKTIFVLQNDLKKDSREIKDISILMGFAGSKCKVRFWEHGIQKAVNSIIAVVFLVLSFLDPDMCATL